MCTEVMLWIYELIYALITFTRFVPGLRPGYLSMKMLSQNIILNLGVDCMNAKSVLYIEFTQMFKSQKSCK